MLRKPRKRAFVAALAGALVLAAGAVTLPAAFAEETGSITGHVIDNGQPVPFAFVTAYDAAFGWHGSATTDSAGAFEFAALPAGDYKLQYRVENYTQWSGQASSFDEAAVVTVVAGQTTTVEEAIRPYGLISGHVTNPDGSPAVNAQVNASSASGSGFGFATTDSTGFYTMRYLAPGNYRVTFQQDWNSPTQWANNATNFSDAALIPVTAGETTTLDQTFLPFATVTGTITDNGQPAAGVRVGLREVNGAGSVSTTTDGDGQYRLSVFPGTYVVEVARGTLTQYVPGQTSYEDAQHFVIGDGTTIIDEELLPTGTVTGTLTQADGSPVPWTSVEVYGTTNTFHGTTDFQGNFTVLAYPGEYRVVFHTQYGRQWADGKSSAATADPVVVVAGESTVVDEVLAPFGSVSVNAVDSVTGDPVNEFCLQATFGYTCTTNGTVVDSDALPGRYGIVVFPQDGLHVDAESTVEVTSGATTSITVPLTRGASITTTMKDRTTGAPVENACLELVEVTQPASLGLRQQWCSDAAGSVHGPLIRPGTYKAFVWAQDGVHGHQWVGNGGGVGQFKKARTITVTSGASIALPAVRLDKAGTIAGTVTDEATGEPVTGGVVALSSYDYGYGGQPSMFPIDDQGRYSVPNLGPYQWTLYFAANGYAAEWMGDKAYRDRAATVKVKEGRTTTYDTEVGRDTTVTGQVLGPDGTPVSTARILFVNADSADNMAVGDIWQGGGQTYTTHVKGPQRVKIYFFGNGQGYAGWIGGTSFANAQVFTIPDAAEYVFDVTLPPPSM